MTPRAMWAEVATALGTLHVRITITVEAPSTWIPEVQQR